MGNAERSLCSVHTNVGTPLSLCTAKPRGFFRPLSYSPRSSVSFHPARWGHWQELRVTWGDQSALGLNTVQAPKEKRFYSPSLYLFVSILCHMLTWSGSSPTEKPTPSLCLAVQRGLTFTLSELSQEVKILWLCLYCSSA